MATHHVEGRRRLPLPQVAGEEGEDAALLVLQQEMRGCCSHR